MQVENVRFDSLLGRFKAAMRLQNSGAAFGRTVAVAELCSIRRARTAYEEGNATYLIVLEATRQQLDTLLREAQLQADFRRARAVTPSSASCSRWKTSSPTAT